MFKLRILRFLKVIDDRAIKSSHTIYITSVVYNIGHYLKTLPAFLTRLRHQLLVLGIPCLRNHGVRVGIN